MKRKIRPRFRAYDLILRAVEEGLEYGWLRAHKYVDDPTQETILEEMEQAVMNTLDAVIDFERTR